MQPIFLQHTRDDVAILARNIERSVANARADRADASIMLDAQIHQGQRAVLRPDECAHTSTARATIRTAPVHTGAAGC